MAFRPRRPELPRPLPTLARTKFGGPAGSRPRRAARRRAGTSWARPLPARGLPHVPLPLCSGGALTLTPGRNFPYPGNLRPAPTPSPGGARAKRVPSPRGHCVRRAPTRPPGRPREGLCGSRARPPRARRHLPPSFPRPGHAPRQSACNHGGSESRQPHAGAANGSRPAPATLPRARLPHPPSGPGLHTTGFTHSAEGREDSPGEVAATIFASPAVGSRSRLPTRLRFTTTGGPRPGVRPAGRPTPRRSSARGASRDSAAGVVPTPSASPEGAKWREGAGQAAAAAPRRTMWVNEGRRLPPQRKYGQAPLPH